MADRFELHVLPAGHGDCLWVEYGDAACPRRLLIDGGTRGTLAHVDQRLRELPPGQRRFELVVVTHIDADHIAGMLELMERPVASFEAGDVWFNGYRHLLPGELDSFGALQGERLTRALLTSRRAWNAAFGGGPAALAADGAPVRKELPGGMEVFVLSPTRAKLALLRGSWEAECRKAGLDPTQEAPPPAALPAGVQAMGGVDVDALADAPFAEDSAVANGSSVVLLLRYRDRTLLLGADAHPSVLSDAFARLPERPDALDAFKLPHHGSRNNTSAELLGRMRAATYVFSTNGAYFRHPDREAVARVIKYGGQASRLVFNYRSEHNQVWSSAGLQRRYGYAAEFGDGAHAAVVKLI